MQAVSREILGRFFGAGYPHGDLGDGVSNTKSVIQIVNPWGGPMPWLLKSRLHKDGVIDAGRCGAPFPFLHSPPSSLLMDRTCFGPPRPLGTVPISGPAPEPTLNAL